MMLPPAATTPDIDQVEQSVSDISALATMDRHLDDAVLLKRNRADDDKEAIGYLLDALSARQLQLQRPSGQNLAAPRQRAIITRTHLMLPVDLGLAEMNATLELQRAAAAHAVAHLLFSPASLPTGRLKPLSVVVISAIEDARAERMLIREWPGLRRWFVPLLARSLQADGLSVEALISRMSYALMEPSYHDGNYWVSKARRLFEGLADRLDDYWAFREIGSILANDLGQMRVRFHSDQYVVPATYRDDNTYLWKFPDSSAEQRVDLDADTAVDAPSTAGAAPDAVTACAPGKEVVHLPYDEWDYRIGLPRTNWCTLIEHGASARHTRGIEYRELTRPALKLPAVVALMRHRRLRRQTEGEELDLDAAVEYVIDRCRGCAEEHRIFSRPGRSMEPMSLLIVLDLSASSVQRVGALDRTILDLEKDGALMFGRAAAASGHRVAIHGFESNTRNAVNYYRLLDFGVPLDAAHEDGIRSAAPRYSTRMGTALRHATALISRETASRRAIVILTDGAPSDVDVFDPLYLKEDARVATIHAQRAGITVAALTMDPSTLGDLRYMTGACNCWSISDPTSLPRHLMALYRRLVR